MLFFKPKHKEDEFLPPPPPFPTVELEEEKETSKKEKTNARKKVKQIKEKKIIPFKKSVKFPELEEDFELKDIGFKLPKELEPELPETLEDFDIEYIEKETKKPKEILEAEEEIKNAIEKIKKEEKPSFLKQLFTKKRKTEEEHKELMPEPAEGNEVSVIQNSINKAREALMKFDLETAKKNYIEIIKLYNRIVPEEQAKVYHDINDLYFERKSAEELKV